jgi:translation initiation factor 2 gamma subunit (eIF-2gamma)
MADAHPHCFPQTSEHLAAVEIMKLKNIIILQVGVTPQPCLLLGGTPVLGS